MTASCANCDATLAGRYCASCGQDARARLTFKELAGQVIGGLLDLDSRLWRTLRDLAVPGRITAEYLAGRRARYMPPVQTYLVVALIFFAIVPAGIGSLVINLSGREAVEARAASAGIDPQLEARRLVAGDQMPTASAEFQRGVSLFSLLMFVTMPFRRAGGGRDRRLGGMGVRRVRRGRHVTKPTMGLVGEAGPEAIIPLSQLNSLRGGGETTVIVELDGRQIARTVFDNMPSVMRVRGMSA